MNASIDNLSQLQARQERIRNLCVIAHVDHGKTSLTDHLIGSNGLIHPKLQGELRYLDSNEEEQRRGITMKSSSIALLYVPGSATRPEGPKGISDEEKLSKGYLINLIDSPGHVDFCSEVSTAARLSDGAVVVVDAVEGVCIQTHAVLRQAWEEKVVPCLFINKIDRLILELKMTPAEAASRISSIVMNANMVISAFDSEKFLSEADAILACQESVKGATSSSSDDPQVDLERVDLDAFRPESCNVAFGSAFDGWAFRLDQFSSMYADKLGCNPDALTRALWGGWAYNVKEKKVVSVKGGEDKKTMFVQFALEPIWKAYSVCEDGAEAQPVLSQIVKSRGLSSLVPTRALEQSDLRQALRAVMRAWLPLSEAVLGMAVNKLPGPSEAAPYRITRLLHSSRHDRSRNTTNQKGQAGIKGARKGTRGLSKEALETMDHVERSLAASSSSSDAPLVVFVSKMVAMPSSLVPRLPGDPSLTSSPDEEVFLGFGRVFSGTARAGVTVHVLSAAYQPNDPDSIHRQTVVLGPVFMMMGRALERVQSVPSGNILAIGGLGDHVLKSATLSSTPHCYPLSPMMFQATAIVRVAVEPAKPSDMQQLIIGLKLLNRADPFVEISVMESGEHVVGAAGEVHLETCIKDLKDRFAKIELRVSAPLVSFRESIHCPHDSTLDFDASSTGQEQQEGGGGEEEGASAAGLDDMPVLSSSRVVEGWTPNGCLMVRARALPLPGSIAAALEELGAEMKRWGRGGCTKESEEATAEEEEGEEEEGGVSLTMKMDRLIKASGGSLASIMRRAWQVGPKGVGPNLLLASPSSSHPSSDLFDLSSTQVVVKVNKQQQQHLGGLPGSSVNSHSSTLDPSSSIPSAQQGNFNDASQWVSVSLGSDLSLARMLLGDGESAFTSMESNPPQGSNRTFEALAASVESGVISGFQLATSAGPLCEEAMWGVAFDVQVKISTSLVSSSSLSPSPIDQELQEEVYGPFSGQVMTAVSSACKRAVMEAEPRIVEAMYLAEVQSGAEALSGVYAVLGKRRAKILREEMKEGSDTFLVHAHLPVAASFGLADDIRRKCSGAASVSLLMSHWERLTEDPFFVPTTEEEKEEYGEEINNALAATTNVARRLIDATRRRKGLAVEEKVVSKATKQRTLKRNV